MFEEDYLWDKKGVPDAETERLEKTLGAFRHQAGRPAWLEEFAAEEPLAPAPNVVPFAPRRRRQEWLRMPQAVAAAVTLCLLAGGLWLGLQNHSAPERANVVAAALNPAPRVETPEIAPPKEVKPTVRPASPDIAPLKAIAVKFTPRPARVAAKKTTPRQPFAPEADEITPAQGRKALADLALAMQVLNTTLNKAQRNAEGRTIVLRAGFAR
jgi:hypothetical protein